MVLRHATLQAQSHPALVTHRLRIRHAPRHRRTITHLAHRQVAQATSLVHPTALHARRTDLDHARTVIVPTRLIRLTRPKDHMDRKDRTVLKATTARNQTPLVPLKMQPIGVNVLVPVSPYQHVLTI
jgi:hypothetical protein